MLSYRTICTIFNEMKSSRVNSMFFNNSAINIYVYIYINNIEGK